MTPNDSSKTELGEHSREDRLAALFANLVIQQTNTALILLGRVPNPETGQPTQDLEAAQLFIDQLEMIEVKTKGNLDKREEHLLKQSLMTLRMAYVEAVENPSGSTTASASAQSAKPEAAPSSAGPADAPSTPSSSTEEESRKKFSKKY